MSSIASIRTAIMKAPENRSYTDQGISPLFQAGPTAKILIVGQAPGWRAEERQQLFADPSGDSLRKWLGVGVATFYDSCQFAILPMDFYYPGKGKSGDLPPRRDFAPQWHPQLLTHLPQLELIILIGRYAQEYYLKDRKKRTLTETVRAYEEYLPRYFPLVHPSPRNNIWQAKNPWFATELLPKLQERVDQIVNR
ncbi:uracil-DNA glycosylase [Streptococcus azizii]|uniref:Uracil-DNA glycosylase n=1 Tax=Streptococcus azizii TaxID=1579424 RepID=A0AB36JQQ6_9STRE|nr:MULTISPECIES: uracil-DNA glycosylase family protein [Streptococcus]MBF0776744.1 uracil-DNA glycosylase family protein [Streptococcus sp. 19428wD3_AN2]ONK27547.1 uracil-DNA glycosylase [Streptococcus azizii]ONK27668.1 uracil-DNA glycosylase [Streptococcus azizii]ONK29848.1 uracil-DNA glycosylase [Streptococcus azizii]TFU82481.1 uracil-DNA glycosylase family protein [Streptococcus sp. AN2]